MVRRGSRERAKEWHWRRVLRDWRRSGQGVRRYCLENGLSEPSFYAWRRIIEGRNRQAARRTPGKVSVEDAGGHRGSGGSLPAFVPLTVAPAPMAPSPACLEVVLGDGRVVRVPAGFDAGTLRQLLAVLQEASPC